MTPTVLVYDVVDDRRRTQVARLLERLGDRVQYSVFEAWLDADRIESLLREVRELIDLRTDDFRIYSLCGSCRRKLRSVGRSEQRRQEVEGRPPGYRLV